MNTTARRMALVTAILGAAGAAGESNTIRLGTEGVHSTTLLSGRVGIGTETPTQARLVVSGFGDSQIFRPA